MLPALIVAELAALFVLFAASAFFSISETAMIGVNRHTVRRRAEAGDARARRVDRMLDQPERILSTVLVGNTIVNVAAATLATAVATHLLASWATLVAAVLVTIIILIFCELVPKTIAVRHALGIALRVARPLQVIEIVMKPFVAIAGATAKAIVRLFGERPTAKTPYITSDEIEMLVRMGVEGGAVEHFEQRVIKDVFNFTETDVAKVMTPADRVHLVPKNASLAQAARLAAKQGHSRIVVVDKTFDEVLGVVHIKDLLNYGDDELDRLPVTLVLRDVLYASHDLTADRLLTLMQKEHKLMAVIQDGAKRNIGIVTGDDLVEELVGEMHDEFDRARPLHRDEHYREHRQEQRAANEAASKRPADR